METFGLDVRVVEPMDMSLYMPCAYDKDELVFIECVAAGAVSPVLCTRVSFYRLRESRSFHPSYGYGAIGNPIGPIHVMSKGVYVDHCEDEEGNVFSSSYCDEHGEFDLEF